jgi:hypothetical protein
MLQLQESGQARRARNALKNESKPQRFAEASKSKARAWMNSMREELSSLMNSQTWSLVDLPPGREAIRCGWIKRLKRMNMELTIESITPSRLLETT